MFHGDEELAFDSIQIITAAVKEWFKASNVSSIKCAKVEAWFAKLLLAILVLQVCCMMFLVIGVVDLQLIWEKGRF